MINNLGIILFHMQILFQNGANNISEMVNIIYRFLSKRSQSCVVWIRSDFAQILSAFGNTKNSKELQIVFGTCTVSNTNGNMKELEHKNQLMFQ